MFELFGLISDVKAIPGKQYYARRREPYFGAALCETFCI
jgi:hypothetical protein